MQANACPSHRPEIILSASPLKSHGSWAYQALANSHADAFKAIGHAVEKADAVRQAGPNLSNGEERERRNEWAEAPFRLVLPPREGKARREKSIDPDGLRLLDENTAIPVNSLFITVGFKMRGGDASVTSPRRASQSQSSSSPDLATFP